MNIQIGDKVLIKKNLDGSTPIEPEYINKEGVVVDINLDRPAPISVEVEGVGADGFWEEELEKI